MKTLALACASLALLLVPPTATATEEFACHSWEVFAGDRSTGAGVSPDDGAAYVGVEDLRGFSLYVVSDGDPVRNPWIFSIWLYEETNGEPGLQRGDEVCHEEGDWYEPDCSFLCGF